MPLTGTVNRAVMSIRFTSRVCHLLVLLPEHQCQFDSPVGYVTWTVTRASMSSRFTRRVCHLLELLLERKCQVGSPGGFVTYLNCYPSINVTSVHQSGLSLTWIVTRTSMSSRFTSRVCHLLELLSKHQCQVGSPVGFITYLYCYPSINIKSVRQVGSPLILLPEHQCQVVSPGGFVISLYCYPSINVKSVRQSGMSLTCTVTRASMSSRFTRRVCHLLVFLPEHQCQVGSPVGFVTYLKLLPEHQCQVSSPGGFVTYFTCYPSINVKSVHQLGLPLTCTVTRASMSSRFTSRVCH